MEVRNLISQGCIEEDLSKNIYQKELLYFFKDYFKENKINNTSQNQVSLDYYAQMVQQQFETQRSLK